MRKSLPTANCLAIRPLPMVWQAFSFIYGGMCQNVSTCVIVSVWHDNCIVFGDNV